MVDPSATVVSLAEQKGGNWIGLFPGKIAAVNGLALTYFIPKVANGRMIAVIAMTPKLYFRGSMVGFVEGFDGGSILEGSEIGLVTGSGDVPSPVPSAELTTVSGIVLPEFSRSCLGAEGIFKESVSKIVPSFGAVALTWLVEDGTRPISSSSSFSCKSSQQKY
ncbi:hypothetical protein HAX54_040613 [Datura stramonium]|uniref:Uncharacterized protein n=1 Tax=Datura stramonium TaxID=4076 RepID=A0ABS8SKI4_DATST|nr:hypothetical protein [Datura stramonium]